MSRITWVFSIKVKCCCWPVCTNIPHSPCRVSFLSDMESIEEKANIIAAPVIELASAAYKPGRPAVALSNTLKKRYGVRCVSSLGWGEWAVRKNCFGEDNDIFRVSCKNEGEFFSFEIFWFPAFRGSFYSNHIKPLWY